MAARSQSIASLPFYVLILTLNKFLLLLFSAYSIHGLLPLFLLSIRAIGKKPQYLLYYIDDVKTLIRKNKIVIFTLICEFKVNI